MATVWTLKSGAAVTLSDDDHLASSGGGSGNEGVIADGSGKSSGKWYFELTDVTTPGAGLGLGIGPDTQSLTTNNYPEFRIGGTGFVNTPSGSGYSTGLTVAGHDVSFAIDLDNDRAWIRVDNGSWYGPSGSGADPSTPSTGYSLSSRAATVHPTAWLQFNPCTVRINAGDRAFDYSVPSGFTAWDAGAVDGDADGQTVIVTASLIPGAVEGDATGATLTVNASLIAGTAGVGGAASGATMTSTASLLSGVAAAGAMDGSPIYEVGFVEVPDNDYSVSDYHSIWSVGDRVANGLISAIQGGWANVVQPFDRCFNGDYKSNDGFEYGSDSNEQGAYVQWTFNETAGFVVEGMRMMGEQSITSPDVFVMYGGGPTALYPFSYMSGASGFVFNQTSTYTARSTYYFANISITPINQVPWSTYRISYKEAAATAGRRFTNEMELQVRHSNLDGGDRRTTNGDPSKRVTISLSSGWFERTGGAYGPLATNAIDGDNWTGTDLSGHVYAETQIGSNSGASAPMNTAGEYIQFVFPRPVRIDHLLFQLTTGTESYSGDDPTLCGVWHWEVSNNNGASWYAVGDPWSFRENCHYAVAPRESTFGLPGGSGGVGEGRTHWRMVLDAGPAFGGSATINQIMFNLRDTSGIAPTLEVAFTDDEDGVPATPSIGPAGSPYIVAFSDGSDDKLTFEFENTPNPLLSVAFTDEAQLDSWSDLYPSMVVQTIVIANGRKTS